MTTEQLTKLRNKEPLKLFDRNNTLFVHIQFNKHETKFVCWERWISVDRKNWAKHNAYLSLKDIKNILDGLRSDILDKVCY